MFPSPLTNLPHIPPPPRKHPRRSALCAWAALREPNNCGKMSLSVDVRLAFVGVVQQGELVFLAMRDHDEIRNLIRAS